MNQRNLIIIAVIVVVIIAAFFAFKPKQQQANLCSPQAIQQTLMNQALYQPPYDNVTGNPNGYIKIVVFYNRTYPIDLINKIKKDFVATEFIFRHLPTKPEQNDPTTQVNVNFARNLCLKKLPAYAIYSGVSPYSNIPKAQLLQDNVNEQTIQLVISQLGS